LNAKVFQKAFAEYGGVLKILNKTDSLNPNGGKTALG
jgi:hypothetical protein